MKFKFKRRRRQSLYRHAFHVYRDWLILLLVTAVVIVGSMLFHVYLFYHAQADSVIDLSGVSSRLTVNRTELQTTIDTYTKLKEGSESKKQQFTEVVDPSL